MRKNILLVLLITLSTSAFSQFKLGFQFSPLLSANRVQLDSDSLDLDSDGTGLRFAFGPIVDIQLTDNYYVSSGILFASKRVGFEGTNRTTGTSGTEEYNLQYIQIPISMKLFTNEVSLDKRLYFQFGGNIELNIQEEADSRDNVLVEDFRFFDFSLLAGLGMEYRLGTSTIVFGGISYHRGLVNAVSDQGDGLDDDIILKNDYIGLNFGIKF